MAGLKHAVRGTPFRIPTDDYNEIINATRRSLANKETGPNSTQHDQNGLILIRNSTDNDVGRFGVLGMDVPIVLPSEDLETFKSSLAISCVDPVSGTHEGKYVILQQPIKGKCALYPNGGIGLAMLMGATPCTIYVNDEDDEYAEIADGVTSYLSSAASGSAQILWKDSGTGEVDAIVRFPFRPTGIVSVRQDAYSNASGHVTTLFKAGETIGVRWVSLISFSNDAPVPVALPKRAYVFAARYASAIGLVTFAVQSVYEGTWYLEAITEPYSPASLNYAGAMALSGVVLDQFKVRQSEAEEGYGWAFGGGAYPGSFCWRADLSSLLSSGQQCYGLRLRESGDYTGGTTLSPEFNRLQAFVDGVE